MGDRTGPAVSDAELEVLKILWENGPLGVRDALEILTNSGQKWSRSTVVTLLRRLEQKRFVKSDKSGYAFVYRSVLSREEFMHARVSEVADELSDGEPLPLMLAFAQHEKFTVEELNRLQKMIDELKNRTRRKETMMIVSFVESVSYWLLITVWQNLVTTALLVPVVLLLCRIFRHRPAIQHLLWLALM